MSVFTALPSTYLRAQPPPTPSGHFFDKPKVFFFTQGQTTKQVAAAGGAGVLQFPALPYKAPHTCPGECWAPGRGTGCP